MNDIRQKMLLAEQKAKALFEAVEQQGLIAAGKTELQLSDEVAALAKEQFNTDRFWHKKIVRTGVNTIQSFSGNPGNLVIKENDILFIDFGPLFDGYEADLGRTYVLGNDPLKLKLKNDVEVAWHEARNWYFQQTSLTGAEFFNYLLQLAKRYGWKFGGEIGGHLVGPYPHEQPDDPADLCFDIHPDNHSSILEKDKQGADRNWILEIQFTDRANKIGGFFEQLLN